MYKHLRNYLVRPVMPVLKQLDHEFHVSLGYIQDPVSKRDILASV